MTTWWLAGVVAGCLAGVGVHAQQAIPGQHFGFDYLIADFTNFNVTKFEMQIDGAAWTDLAIPPVADDSNTLSGAHTYTITIPPLTTGPHTVAFRACNTAAPPNNCSAASAALSFNMVVFTSPGNVRILGGGGRD